MDLSRCVVLERFEFDLDLASLFRTDIWFHHTLRTINSTAFNEFVMWILDIVDPWSLRRSLSDGGWRIVDALLDDLADRNPDFRVVVKGDFDSFRCGMRSGHCSLRWLVVGRLPLVSSKGLVKFEQVPDAENRFRKLGIL